MKRGLSIFLALCMLFTLAACSTAGGVVPNAARKPETTPAGRVETAAPPVLAGLRPAADYGEVFAAVKSVPTYGYTGVRFTADDAVAEAEPAADGAPAPEPSAAPMESGGVNSDYSQTNVQVAGIDEGDIVKTDGTYIYVLRQNELIIFRAAGAETKELFRKTVGESSYEELTSGAEEEYKGSASTERRPTELYVSGDRLAVVYAYDQWGDTYDSAADAWTYESENRLEAELYDVSAPESPRLIASVGQDGIFQTSRMVDGTLYLISNYWLYDPVAEDEPVSFVPCLYRDGAAEPVDCGCIWIPEVRSSTRYTVVSAFAMADGAEKGNVSLLGGCDDVYMNHSNLYLARELGGETAGEPYTESVYTVTEYSYRAETELTRVSLADGGLMVAANGKVDGYLLNQFAMDEYDGYLRLVTTSEGYSYTQYVDESKGFTNCVWPEEQVPDTNNLFLLDEDLKTVGSITGLAEDERVYSVRFDGEIGYFVTFRETDPLFAVDLSDPTEPKLLSALKIPGFSQYLHVYGTGRLFGLGKDADPETGAAGGMKLSMFDTSDPAHVTEKHTLLLENYWSEALYNHRAILISPEKDIIAFPSENGYVIYGYSDEQGFFLRAEIEGDADTWWYGNARGLYIGQYAYVIQESQIWVLDLERLSQVQTIRY